MGGGSLDSAATPLSLHTDVIDSRTLPRPAAVDIARNPTRLGDVAEFGNKFLRICRNIATPLIPNAYGRFRPSSIFILLRTHLGATRWSPSFHLTRGRMGDWRQRIFNLPICAAHGRRYYSN